MTCEEGNKVEACEVCQGRTAWSNGQPRGSNPYLPPAEDQPHGDSYYQNSWVLWDIGWQTGKQPTASTEKLIALGLLTEDDLNQSPDLTGKTTSR